jgi:hypothetical protein
MIPLLYGHAIWRDEAQAFLIARDSHSIGEMFYNLRLEGHPPLWYFILYGLTRITARPEAMQWLHLAMTACTVYLVVRYAPFPWLAKILFPFGFFLIFEYGLISRNYQLVLLFGILFCIVWSRRRSNFVLLGLILALLALSHAFGVILAAGFGLMIVVEAIVTRDEKGRRTCLRWQFAAGGALAVPGVLSAAILTTPASGAAHSPPWVFDLTFLHVQQTLRAVCNGFMPFAPWQLHFRDVSIFRDDQAALWGVLIGVAAFACVITSWRAVIFLLVAELGLLTLFHIKFPGVWHHHGMVFFTWILALWIYWSDKPGGVARYRIWNRVPQGALVLALAAQVYAARVPLYFCWNYPFSRGQDAASFIRKEIRPGDILASDLALVTVSVAAYLPGEKIYYAAEHRWGTFAVWDLRWWIGATPADILSFAATQPHRVLFIHCSARGSLPGAKRLAVFDGGIADFEEFSIFEIDPVQPGLAPEPSNGTTRP